MSVSHTQTACIVGAKVIPVRVEVDIRPGLPKFDIIGLPDKRIAEAKQRIQSAMDNCEVGFPVGKIVVNLSPSDIPKNGTYFDLAIALGLLQARRFIREIPENIWVFGELSLDGLVKSSRHCLALVIEAYKQKVANCIIPLGNYKDINTLIDINCYPVISLTESINLCRNNYRIENSNQKIGDSANFKNESQNIDLNYAYNQIIGQYKAKRALLIALAGGHNLFLTGAPGSGKTMLAKSASELMPSLSRLEKLEILQIYNLTNEKWDISTEKRPFRSPHHTITSVGMFGGGNNARPGEMSLAHKGILFLDEFPEFGREVREGLRQPLQDKRITITRNNLNYEYPADSVVIVAQNNCPCGLKGVSGQYCRCSPKDLMRYNRAVSEPILDRFDMYCEIEKMPISDWMEGESDLGKNNQTIINDAESIKQRIQKCWEKQYSRYGGELLNSTVKEDHCGKALEINDLCKELIKKAEKSYYLSGRALKKIILVARTIADLSDSQNIELEHIKEALMFRRKQYEN